MPTSGNAAASTALPHPANVSQNVPMASAAHLRISIEPLPGLLRPQDRLPVAPPIYHGPAACVRLIEGLVEEVGWVARGRIDPRRIIGSAPPRSCAASSQ